MRDQEPNNGVFINQSADQEGGYENWVPAIDFDQLNLWFPNAPIMSAQNRVHEASCLDMMLNNDAMKETDPCMQTNFVLHKGESSGTKHDDSRPPAPKMQTNKGEAEEEPKTSDKRKLATRPSPIAGRKVYQRLRRQKLKEKMMTIQELIPNCNKRDSLSTLDDAIKYIQNLQCQHQLMTTIGQVSSMLNSQLMSNPQGFQIPYLASFLSAVLMKHEIETGIIGKNSPFNLPMTSQFGLRNPYLLPSSSASASGLMSATTTVTTTNSENREINFSELLNLTSLSSYTHTFGVQSPTNKEARDGSSSKNELCPFIHDHERIINKSAT